ncbi:MAG: biotin synthase BioB [Gammaproteobacteria bacterium]|nr:biotin synthase BioB [Gammaproteobacteria bacterium]
MSSTQLRHDWSQEEIEALLDLPFNDLMFQAQIIHRENFDPNTVQVSTLLSIKTGTCSEDCGYCSQSSKYNTELEPEKLLPLEQVIETAQAAKDKGATRFCMGAAWRNPTDTNLDSVIDMIEAVHDLNMESCVTLGMLNEGQVKRLSDVGLNYYNHNLDTSPEFYGNVITTRTYQDRLDTLEHVRAKGINICSGGILGMGESRKDRASMLRELSNLPKHPESVPINMLVQVEGTPLYGTEALDPFEFVRIIAVARILMPESNVRLSAGRTEMNDEMQSLCFLAGANSMFYGDRLLTTDNPDENRDHKLFERLGMQFEQVEELPDAASSAQA